VGGNAYLDDSNLGDIFAFLVGVSRGFSRLAWSCVVDVTFKKNNAHTSAYEVAVVDDSD
jgi:hypothetical protein